MIDTERSLETVVRLQDEIMRERAEELKEAALAAKTRLAEREAALARLREQVAALKAALAPAPAPRPAPAPVVRAETPARTARVAAPAAAVPVRTAAWRPYAPYAAIAACAVLIELGGARLPAPAAPDLSALAHPAPAPVANDRPAAKGAPVVTDDDRSEEALLLVHEWKLPGDEKSLGERLGGELDLPGGRPSWTVERTGAHGYRVTFQPAEKDLPYSFEADIESRVVWPTPETQELLAPRFTAAFRDAVR
ncbi:MAG: hypothetical protein HYV14_05300 [Elusimicrobia bacterium]|nr:hypothetical protein [Elusimicrobiota bacterium]